MNTNELDTLMGFYKMKKEQPEEYEAFWKWAEEDYLPHLTKFMLKAVDEQKRMQPK